MPELPEVEMVRRVLAPHIVGERICGVKLLNQNVIGWPRAEEFAEGVCSRQIMGTARRGKFLQILLDGGACIVLHFRMTGALLLMRADEPKEKHTHVVFALEDGRELRYIDQRRFGRLWLVQTTRKLPNAAGNGSDEMTESELAAATDDPGDTRNVNAEIELDAVGLAVTGMNQLGFEPFDARVTWKFLRDKLGGRRKSIKECLLDQSVIAGVGNIYSDEILFASKIYPGQSAATLTAAQWKRLAAQIPVTMEYYVEKNEISFEDYVKGKGKDYRNTPYLKVYGQKDKPCPNCGTRLEGTRIGGRSSVYCPKCQRMRSCG